MGALMRCNQSHWQGNKFIIAGTIRPAGHPEVLPEFFEPFDVDGDEPTPAKKATKR